MWRTWRFFWEHCCWYSNRVCRRRGSSRRNHSRIAGIQLSAMGHFHYARHFAVLAAAAIVLFLPSRWNLFSGEFLPTFAISGALHALTLVFALRATHALLRKCAFVALAAALSAITLYIGILSLQL